MKIQSAIHNYILKACELLPFESGGIIGSKNGVITSCLHDVGLEEKGSMGHYVPDTEALERQIALWQKEDIEFCGMYHSHFVSHPWLSSGDVQYIKEIMNSLDGAEKLLFPLVLVKEKQIVFFEAVKTEKEISITKVDVEII